MLVENSATAHSLLRQHWKLLPAVLIILIVVEIGNDYIGFDRPALSLATVGLLISALSIFLAFRINEAYSRWWEARILWGNFIGASRAFARKVTTLIDVDSADEAGPETMELRRELVYRHIALAHALRLSLRDEDDWDELRPFLGDEEFSSLMQAINKPTHILQRQGERLADTRRRGWLTDAGQTQLNLTFNELHNAQVGCERIKNTPFPDNVAYAARAIAWGMAIIVPVAITDQSNRFELVDMVVVPILMLSFVLIERLGAELRNPFENGPNDTPMTTLCREVERELRQALGEESLPPAIEPRDGVLM
jgi:putative membrane protein